MPRPIAPTLLIALLAAPIGAAIADDNGGAAPATSAAKPATWEFGITAYPTNVRNGENYTSAIARADRGALHLEARSNYESIGARSAFIGWTFSGENVVTWSLTPMAGGAWGTTRAFVPGLEASVAYGHFDFYTEIELVRDRRSRTDSYAYSWSELGYKPVDWLRVGLSTQRTRTYNDDRDLQRGPFAQVTWGRVTFGGYWFNPGSKEQVFVGAIGATF